MEKDKYIAYVNWGNENYMSSGKSTWSKAILLIFSLFGIMQPTGDDIFLIVLTHILVIFPFVIFILGCVVFFASKPKNTKDVFLHGGIIVLGFMLGFLLLSIIFMYSATYSYIYAVLLVIFPTIYTIIFVEGVKKNIEKGMYLRKEPVKKQNDIWVMIGIITISNICAKRIIQSIPKTPENTTTTYFVVAIIFLFIAVLVVIGFENFIKYYYAKKLDIYVEPVWMKPAKNDMKTILNKKWIMDDPSYLYNIKHYCNICSGELVVKRVERIINSKSPEAKNYDFSFSGTDGGFLFGDIEFSFEVFYCPNCGIEIPVREIRRQEYMKSQEYDRWQIRT